MKNIIKYQKGFIHIPSLIGIIVSIIVIAIVIGYGKTPTSEPITTTTTITVTVSSNSTTTIESSVTTTTTLTTTSIPTSGSSNTKKTITSSYDYSKLSNKYRNRALYVACVPKIIRSHEYLDPLLKDLEDSDEDKKINALLQLQSDSNFNSSEQITLFRNSYQTDSKLKSILIEWADTNAKFLRDLYALETPKSIAMNASGFLLTDKIFLTANHVNVGINSLSQQCQQEREKFYSTKGEKGLKFFDFLFDLQISCYVQPLNFSQKYLIRLPFTELGSDIAIGYSDQSIPTNNLQSFSLCKEPPKIGSSVYTPSYPGGEFLESFGTVLNKISQMISSGKTVTGDIYITNIDTIPGSSGGGVIMYTNNSDCLFGIDFAGSQNKLFSGKAKSYATGILPYIDKIKAIMQE